MGCRREHLNLHRFPANLSYDLFVFSWCRDGEASSKSSDRHTELAFTALMAGWAAEGLPFGHLFSWVQFETCKKQWSSGAGSSFLQHKEKSWRLKKWESTATSSVMRCGQAVYMERILRSDRTPLFKSWIHHEDSELSLKITLSSLGVFFSLSLSRCFRLFSELEERTMYDYAHAWFKQVRDWLLPAWACGWPKISAGKTSVVRKKESALIGENAFRWWHSFWSCLLVRLAKLNVIPNQFLSCQ